MDVFRAKLFGPVKDFVSSTFDIRERVDAHYVQFPLLTTEFFLGN